MLAAIFIFNPLFRIYFFNAPSRQFLNRGANNYRVTSYAVSGVTFTGLNSLFYLLLLSL